ncbi:hypothetical protein BDZ45DRAFT_22299 [Acephala macrosclerotiorum]|nr:hypothetical protein BDZ45DRAFT_22299 [Acephala macrosclerotiorum]
MPLDPLTALSVAGNICQFVDLAGKLFFETKEIYGSGTGSLASNDNLEQLTNEMLNITQKLKEYPGIVDLELKALCKDCAVDANKLLDALNKLKVQGSKTRYKSMKKALKSVMGRREVRDLQARLAGYLVAINLRVAVNFRTQFDLVALRAEGRLDRLDAHAKTFLDSVIESRDIFETLLRNLTETLKRCHEDTNSKSEAAHEETRSRVMAVIQESDAASRSRHQTSQSEVERLHDTLALVLQQMREQSAAIERLREERDNAVGRREFAAVQDKLNAAYTTLVRLAVLWISLQVAILVLQQPTWRENVPGLGRTLRLKQEPAEVG